MWQLLGSAVDVLHALLMVAWVAGFPLLILTRWPRLTRAYAIYSVAFVVVSQVSRFVLGECVLTTLARWFWEHPGGGRSLGTSADEWFTVRVSKAVFGMAPTHRAIAIASEALAVATAMGVLFAMRRPSHREKARP